MKSQSQTIVPGKDGRHSSFESIGIDRAGNLDVTADNVAGWIRAALEVKPYRHLGGR